MQLDVLTRGDMTDGGSVTISQLRDSAELIGGNPSKRDFDAHHLHTGLPLPINSVLQAERPEEIGGTIAGDQPHGLGFEGFDFFGNGGWNGGDLDFDSLEGLGSHWCISSC
jgi:hypothetical protein